MRIFLIAIIFTFASCKKNTVDINLLTGDWEFSQPKTEYEQDSLIATTYYLSDFGFKKDSIYLKSDGFFYRNNDTSGRYSKTKYFGDQSKYYVKNDSLYILNPITKTYFSGFIKRLTKDSLALQYKESPLFYFTKKKYSKNENSNFDQIIIANGPCFGTCPINYTSLKSDGELIYYGSAYNSKNGLFKGKFSPEKFQEIQNYLNKINIKNFKNDYGNYNITDLSDTYITIIQDGKISKTIHDYGNASPKELRSLYNKLSFLYQETKLDSISYNYPIITSIGINKRETNIYPSESFYLQTLLLNAKNTNQTFTPKYYFTSSLVQPKTFDYEKSDELQRKIETDGRYFNIQNKEKKFTTFDLGYNFFQANKNFASRKNPK